MMIFFNKAESFPGTAGRRCLVGDAASVSCSRSVFALFLCLPTGFLVFSWLMSSSPVGSVAGWTSFSSASSDCDGALQRKRFNQDSQGKVIPQALNTFLFWMELYFLRCCCAVDINSFSPSDVGDVGSAFMCLKNLQHSAAAKSSTR